METKRVKLRIENLSLNFGGVAALSDINLEVRDKEILAVIGPNGAGKTALLNCINGFYKPQKGDIFFEDRRITRLRPDRLAALGIARTFQNIELYTGLTTQDNIMAARHLLMKRSFVSGAWYFGPALKEEIRHRRVAEEIMDFLEIAPLRKKNGGQASLRVAQTGRISPGPGLGTQAPPPGRTHGRDEPRRKGRHGPLHPRRLRRPGRNLSRDPGASGRDRLHYPY